MDEPGRGRWLDEPLLDPLPAPPRALLTVPGAVLLAVSSPAGVEPYRWHPAAALAWARSPASATVGTLLAWESMWRPEDGPDRVAGRWGWFRFEPERCAVMKPTHVPNAWGLGWHGRRAGGAMQQALEAAAGGLPPEVCAAALVPAALEQGARLPWL